MITFKPRHSSVIGPSIANRSGFVYLNHSKKSSHHFGSFTNVYRMIHKKMEGILLIAKKREKWGVESCEAILPPIDEAHRDQCRNSSDEDKAERLVKNRVVCGRNSTFSTWKKLRT